MAKKTTKLVASSKVVDPILDALFASSSGPVQAPSKVRSSPLLGEKPHYDSDQAVRTSANDVDEQEEDDDEALSEISQELEYHDAGEQVEPWSEDRVNNTRRREVGHSNKTEAQNTGAAEEKQGRRSRKRRKGENEDLEAKYLADLTRTDAGEPSAKRQRTDEDVIETGQDDNDAVPTHESLTKEARVSDLEKASRTIFLANVSSEAMTSKAAKKSLISHLSSALDANETPAQKLESIRFRSVAFSTGSMPKRAAFITKSLMNETTKSANAYVVFSTPAAARQVASKLNGTEILGRHVRVDSVAHPNPTDHRRCVFVGNLGFIDDETVVHTTEDGEKVEKKRTKVPADAEEGLWRTFGKIGKLENVRVVRDPTTRVSKGFAYVQFHDANDVEAALLLNGKKFPPMLPRILRVTRAKDPRKTALAQERNKTKISAAEHQTRKTKYTPKMTPVQKAAAGRADKLLGRSGGFLHRKKGSSEAPSSGIVFEGNRASSKDGRPHDLKFGKGKKSKAGRPKNRSARRAAEWKRTKKP